MKAILITGMSGTGKTTLLEELSRRGHNTIETDVGDWCVRSHDGSELIWDEVRMHEYLSKEHSKPVVIAGCVSNQRKFRQWFSAVVLLTAPEVVLMHRIASRTTNPFGKTTEERERILDDLRNTEPLLRASADFVLDATRSVDDLADEIENIMHKTR